jgi:uncharacterized Zn finger protein (UPF0148 family)
MIHCSSCDIYYKSNHNSCPTCERAEYDSNRYNRSIEDNKRIKSINADLRQKISEYEKNTFTKEMWALTDASSYSKLLVFKERKDLHKYLELQSVSNNGKLITVSDKNRTEVVKELKYRVQPIHLK